MENKLSAFVFGGTGSIGGGIVKALARESKYGRVTLFGRRKIEFPEAAGSELDYSKFDQQTVEFENLAQLDPKLFQGFNVGFYALGVSSAKVDEATYRKVEYDYTVSIAKTIKESGCPHFTWVSGRGASKDSWFLFGKVKAQVEEELAQLGFPRLSIIQPAMVLNAENKVGVCITKCLDRSHILSIDSDTLGKVIVGNSLRDSDKKTETLTMVDISRLDKELV